jgi:hypothetical protein
MGGFSIRYGAHLGGPKSNAYNPTLGSTKTVHFCFWQEEDSQEKLLIFLFCLFHVYKNQTSCRTSITFLLYQTTSDILLS